MPSLSHIILVILFFSISPSSDCQELFPSERGIPSSFNRDSFRAYNSYKEICNYNFQNNPEQLLKNKTFSTKLDSMISWRRDTELVPEYKGVVLHTEDDSKEIFYSYSYDETNLNWTPSSYSIREFNKFDQIAKSIYSPWDGSFGNWTDETATIIRTYYYNNDNQLVKREGQNLMDIEKERISNEITFTYDTLGRVVKQTDRVIFPNQDTLLHSRELIYRYNDKNLLSEIIESTFRLDIGWLKPDSTLFTYLPNNLLEEELSFYWSSLGELYEKGYRINYTYNIDGSIKEKINNYSHSSSTNKWSRIEKSEYNYYTYGSLKNIITYDSLINFPELHLSNTTIIHYDESVSFDEVKFPRGTERRYYENHMITNYQESQIDFFSGVTVSNPIIEFYYSPLDLSSTTETHTASSNIRISPNPTSDFITIEISDYSKKFNLLISDIHGNNISNEVVSNGEQVSVANLSPGVYIYSALIDGKIQSGKFVKGW